MSSLLHFVFDLLESRNGLPFRDEDKREVSHFKRGEWKLNLKIVIDEKSVLLISFGLCRY